MAEDGNVGGWLRKRGLWKLWVRVERVARAAGEGRGGAGVSVRWWGVRESGGGGVLVRGVVGVCV